MRAEVLALESLEPSARGNLLRALDTARLSEPIFYSGNLSLLSRPLISMAGSRGASLWALTLMEGLAGHLVAQGCCIVSGGAVGTDIAAHRGALQSGGETIFILPAPLDELDVNTWRPELRGLLDWNRMLFLSPFRRHSTITRSNPIIRNRLIVALAGAAVAGETGLQGGTNHFLHCALTWGVPAYLLDTAPEDVQLRAALADLERRGAVMMRESDMLGESLAKRIAAAGQAYTRKREELDHRQLRLCEDECLYITECE